MSTATMTAPMEMAKKKTGAAEQLREELNLSRNMPRDFVISAAGNKVKEIALKIGMSFIYDQSPIFVPSNWAMNKNTRNELAEKSVKIMRMMKEAK